MRTNVHTLSNKQAEYPIIYKTDRFIGQFSFYVANMLKEIIIYDTFSTCIVYLFFLLVDFTRVYKNKNSRLETKSILN